MTLNMDAVYIPSEDIVARKIEGELIIIPLVAGIGDMEDELYTLNETGVVIWDHLDGVNTLQQVVEKLVQVYDAQYNEIQADIVGLVKELLRRRMLVEVGSL